MGRSGSQTQAIESRSSRSRPGIRAIAAYAAFLLVLLLMLEGAARVLAARSDNPGLRMALHDYGQLAQGDLSRFRFMPDASLPYRLRPGFVFRAPDGVQVTRHNANGFRDDEDFPPKSAGTLRIVCLGGSTTYGVSVVDNGATYPAVLERLLNMDFRPAGWERVEVFNLGVGGYTSREVLQNLELHGLPLCPDLVLIQSGFNDIAPRFFANFTADYSHFRKPFAPLEAGILARWAYRSQFVVVLGWKLGLLRPITLQSQTQRPLPPAAEAVSNLEKNDTGAYRHNLEAAIVLARKSGACVCLLTQAHFFSPVFRAPDEDTRQLDRGYQRGLVEHNEVIRRVAKTTGVGLVDLERAMPLSLRSFADPIHMTEAGNVAKATIVAEHLMDIPLTPASAACAPAELVTNESASIPVAMRDDSEAQ